MMKIQVVLVIFWISELYCQSDRYALKEQFHWDIPEFQFPNGSAKNNALATGSYIPEKNNIWGLGIWKKKIFVSVFRFGVGVVSSFNYFLKNSASKSPVLIPYPSFDANYVNEDPQEQTVGLRSELSIINSGYFRIDYKCDRLWIVDAGFTNFLGVIRVVAEPSIVVIDLKTDRLIRRYTIPPEFINANSFFTNLDIDFKGQGCNNVFAYVVDMFRSILVYSFKEDRSWRMVHNFFGSDPQASYFSFKEQDVQWNFGGLGITVGGTQCDGSKRVYFSALSSTKAYYLSNKILQDEAYIVSNNYYNDVKLLGDRGTNGQMYTWAYDENTKALFEAQFYRGRISCWNTANSYRNSSFAVVYKKKNRLFYPSDVRIDIRRNLWVLENSLPTFLFGAWNSNVKNIRIHKAKVDDVISGTVCKK